MNISVTRRDDRKVDSLSMKASHCCGTSACILHSHHDQTSEESTCTVLIYEQMLYCLPTETATTTWAAPSFSQQNHVAILGKAQVHRLRTEDQ